MDEASQVDIATGALALSCAKNAVIVGDIKQLPNVVTEDIKLRSQAIFNSFKISEGYQFTNSFLQSVLDIMPDVSQVMLREHYRCHPKIINFCNQKFYRGELVVITTDHGEKDVLTVVKTVPGNHARNHYRQRQIDVIKQEIMPEYDLKSENTGIIAPYKNQVEALEKEVNDIDIATVYKFQGSYSGAIWNSISPIENKWQQRKRKDNRKTGSDTWKIGSKGSRNIFTFFKFPFILGKVCIFTGKSRV